LKASFIMPLSRRVDMEAFLFLIYVGLKPLSLYRIYRKIKFYLLLVKN
jgi:hypothetical protein